MNDVFEKALAIAVPAHGRQKDRRKKPYIFHPLHVASKMDTDEERAVAVLHDVLEDTDRTVDDLRAAGLPEGVVRDVLLLTHREKDSYPYYLARVATSPRAVKVKLADLKHNMDLRRLKRVRLKDLKRVLKYLKAYFFLKRHA